MKADVVGAGFSGLVTAFYLVEKGCEVRIFEKEARPGGLIQTLRKSSGLIETAANALINSQNVEDLFRKLDLRTCHPKREARARYIFRGRPRRWPISLKGTLSFIATFARFLTFNSKLRPRSGESVREWGLRVFGPEVTTYLMEPALQGIYAGDPAQMSASLIFSRLFVTYSGPKRHYRKGSVAPPEGMGQLISRLEEYLRQKGVEFVYGSTRSPTENSNLVFYCGSAHGAAEWLKDAAPNASRDLSEIEVRPVTTITAFFEKAGTDIKGFGILFPRDQKFEALGVLFNSHIFDNRSEFRSETWIYAGTAAGLEHVLSDRRKLGGANPPVECVVTQWPHAIPHYTVHLERILQDGLTLPPHIFLVGNYLGDIGLTRILDRAKRTVDEAVK
jgi:protoporphyrinogen/coproporphyrinogen III oxidase